MARRGRGSFWLGAAFALFVLFLYGPILTILVLSFQGPTGGLTFPMRGMSTHWFGSLWSGLGVVDIWSAFGRSVRLGGAVMVLTVVISLLAGYAFRRGFRGATVVFYTAVASLIVPSIVVSLGVGVQFRLLDDLILELRDSLGATVVMVTHELASIFAVGDNGIFLDAESKSQIAVGDPRHLLSESSDPKVQRFLRRGEAAKELGSAP